jgi:L-alanine-DL-glutamate epimerase-like enolase superfamily enzyme
MSPEEIIGASRQALDLGLLGIQMQVGGPSPEADAERVTRVREGLGEDVWLGLDGGRRYDYATALSIGRFYEEEMGVDWFSDPLDVCDIEGHSRLVDKLEVPIAVGRDLPGPEEFQRYINAGAADILLPDLFEVGGISSWVKVAQLAEMMHRPLACSMPSEIGVHMACGLPGVRATEWTGWLTPVFAGGPTLVKGHAVPPDQPGLGLEIRAKAIEKFRSSI